MKWPWMAVFAIFGTLMAGSFSPTYADSYTINFVASPIPVPVADPTVKKSRVVLHGDVPSPANPPSGCVFHPRCQHPAKDAACAAIVPPLEEKAPGHWAACIKQPPTGVEWSVQQAAGATKPPTRYPPVIAVEHTPTSSSPS